MQCPTGIMTDIVAFGVIPHYSNVMDACMPNFETEACDPMYNHDDLKATIVRKCFEQSDC